MQVSAFFKDIFHLNVFFKVKIVFLQSILLLYNTSSVIQTLVKKLTNKIGKKLTKRVKNDKKMSYCDVIIH